MNVNERFESWYCTQYDALPGDIANCRLSNGSYNNVMIGRIFRAFSAGYECHKQEPLKLLGYLSRNGVTSAEGQSAACFKNEPSAVYCVPVFTKGRHK
jgi:hypothetical protein